MKIDNLYQKFNIQNPEQTKQAQGEAQRQQGVRQEPAPRTDRVELSQTARDIKKIESVLKTTPDVRAEKVRTLKDQIEAGTYQVEPKKVANAMVADLLKDIA